MLGQARKRPRESQRGSATGSVQECQAPTGHKKYTPAASERQRDTETRRQAEAGKRKANGSLQGRLLAFAEAVDQREVGDVAACTVPEYRARSGARAASASPRVTRASKRADEQTSRLANTGGTTRAEPDAGRCWAHAPSNGK